MSKRVTFYGASDDLVEVEGIPGADEFNVYGEGLVLASFVVGGKMRVRALYDGCWSFAVGQVDEEVPLPDWPISVSQHGGYSTLVTIEVPDDATLIHEQAV